MQRLLLIAITLIGPLGLVGCGGYASTSEAFRRSLTAGQPEDALLRVNEALEVQRAEDLPSEPGADTPLLLLERATILQALGRNALSARDFKLADKNLDVLDLTGDTAGEISKYLFSDDATVYKAAPYEKLLLNTVNMLNFLVLGDVQGAKVEARRMTINRKFLEKEAGEAQSMMAFGSYLSGFAFEMAGESGPAMRHYGDAYDAGGLPGLEQAVRDLHARSGDSDKRLKDWSTDGSKGDPKEAELLVVVQTGMAPYLLPERLPIGAAVVAASDPGPGARLSSSDRARAQTFAAKGVLKWVQYPRLTRSTGGGGRIEVSVAGQNWSAPSALDVEGRSLAHYDKHKGTLIAASLTRMLTRAVAGELTQAVAKGAGGDNIVGLLAGLAVEGAMTAADTPDTRSWVTLPAKFHIARGRLPAGEHTVTVRYRGQQRTRAVTLTPGGWAVVNFSDLR